jgi:hypothetical protein
MGAGERGEKNSLPFKLYEGTRDIKERVRRIRFPIDSDSDSSVLSRHLVHSFPSGK